MTSGETQPEVAAGENVTDIDHRNAEEVDRESYGFEELAAHVHPFAISVLSAVVPFLLRGMHAPATAGRAAVLNAVNRSFRI